MKTSGGSPPFRDVQETLDKAIKKKGEKAKVLLLMDASLALLEATGLEMDCHCEERSDEAIPEIATLPPAKLWRAGRSQ